MEAAKTFERNGKRYRPGDPIPDGLDAVTRAHYLRYGMIREREVPTPSENKPAAPAQRPRAPGPKPAKTPAPTQTTASNAPGAKESERAQDEGGPQGAERDTPADPALSVKDSAEAGNAATTSGGASA